MPDPFLLDRFEVAQDEASTYATALSELRAGRKTSHWMWFVFPQIRGLGQSAMSRRYAIRSLAEAEAYLQHPVLGPRLVECTRALAESARPHSTGGDGRDRRHEAALVDDALRARRTRGLAFQVVLNLYFAGAADTATEGLLERRDA